MNGPNKETLLRLASKQNAAQAAQHQASLMEARLQADVSIHNDAQMEENRRALARLAMDFYIIEMQRIDTIGADLDGCIDKALDFMDRVGAGINRRIARDKAAAEAAKKAEAPAEPVKTA